MLYHKLPSSSSALWNCKEIKESETWMIYSKVGKLRVDETDGLHQMA